MAATSKRTSARPIVVVLVLVGILALAAGIYYFVTPASKVPTWLPGHVAGATYHHVRRATAAVVVAVLCGVGAWFLAGRQRQGAGHS